MAENILVVCTAGKQRSPTAARLLEEDYEASARAAGIHPQATNHVSQTHVDWADRIIAMNEKLDGHKSYLEENFDTENTPITVFGVPDRYYRDDPELVSLLTEKLDDFMRDKN